VGLAAMNAGQKDSINQCGPGRVHHCKLLRVEASPRPASPQTGMGLLGIHCGEAMAGGRGGEMDELYTAQTHLCGVCDLGRDHIVIRLC
jgi:hypothetical protein